jgi:hypothetical protein
LFVSTVAANSCRRLATVNSAISTLWVRFRRPDLAVTPTWFPSTDLGYTDGVLREFARNYTPFIRIYNQESETSAKKIPPESDWLWYHLLQSRPLPSRHAQVAGSRSEIQPHAIVCMEEKTQEVDGGDIQL